jgi:flagellar protein FlaJ
MKSSRYSVYCHKIFGKFISKHYTKRYLKQKNIVLEKANIAMLFDEYLSMSLMTVIIGFFFALITGLIITLLFFSLTSFLIFLFLLIFLPFGLWEFYQLYPLYNIKKRGQNIDRFLPYAINFISTMAVAGVSPLEIFRSIASIDSYGDLQVESKKIVKRIDSMGFDTISALKYAIDVSPSKRFKTFLQGMVGTIQSGTDLHVYLSNIVENYLEDEFIERKKNLEMLSVVAEIFVISIVAFPLFLVIVLSIMSFLIGPPNFTINTLFIFAFLILPMAYCGFYFLIRTVSIEDIKKYKSDKKLNLKSYYKENKILVFVLVFTLVSLLVFYGLLFGLSDINVISLSNYYIFDIVFISLLIIVGPIGFYLSKVQKEKKEIEGRLSDFFTEMTNNISSGMTVFDGIKTAAKGNYGELTDKIEKMKAELSWRYSIYKVFDNFVERMKSGVIQRVFITINKGLKMGGDTEKVFKAATKEVDQVNRIDAQKKADMSVYTVVVLMSFFVFLAIIFILDRSLFATFFQTSELSTEMTPDAVNKLLTIGKIDSELFKNAMYSFVFVQGFGTGVLSGFMMDGNLSSGIRYSFILGLVCVVVFKVLF